MARRNCGVAGERNRPQQRQPLLSDWPAASEALEQFKQNGIASIHLEDMPSGRGRMDLLFFDYAREVASA